MSDLNFQNDLAIDLDDLHEEWRSHSAIRYKYACELSDLEKIVRKAEEKVKVQRSLLRKECWKDPEETCGKKKITDKDVEAYYRTHDNHKNSKNELFDAQYDLSMAWNAVKAFDDRKKGLENEVVLHGRNYFSTPREERPVNGGKSMYQEIKKEKEKKQGKVQKVQRESLKPKSDKSEKPKDDKNDKPKPTRRRRKKCI